MVIAFPGIDKRPKRKKPKKAKAKVARLAEVPKAWGKKKVYDVAPYGYDTMHVCRGADGKFVPKKKCG